MRDYREFLQRLNGQTYMKKVLETENEVATCNQFINMRILNVLLFPVRSPMGQ